MRAVHGHVAGHRMLRLTAVLCFVLIGVVTLAGCGIRIPTDPEGTLDRARGDVLRIGASPDPGLVRTDGPGVTGPAAELATEFADRIDAETEWTVAGEETLVTMLERGQLDLVIGGFTDQTPWLDRAGTTRGYPGIPGADGRSIVMLVPLGENRLLSTLETFLDREVAR